MIILASIVCFAAALAASGFLYQWIGRGNQIAGAMRRRAMVETWAGKCKLLICSKEGRVDRPFFLKPASSAQIVKLASHPTDRFRLCAYCVV